MNKKKLLISTIALVVIFTVSIFYYFSSVDIKNDQAITEEEIVKIIQLLNQTTGGQAREIYGDFIKKEAFINIVHVIKDGDDYNYFCWLGPAYDRVNLHRFFPENLIALGQIKNCNLENIKTIHGAVISNNPKCSILLDFNMENNEKQDYYLVSLVFAEREITQDLVNNYEEERECALPLKDFIGETAPLVLITLVDLNSNTVYY